MRCAAYARFSSDKQKPVSIEDQLRRCRDFSEKQGWRWLPEFVYTDEAISGVTAHRAGLSALVAAVSDHRARSFDCILVDDTSRISRNLADALRFYERLTFAGVRVIAVSQGVDSTSEQAELMMGVHGLIDSVYSKELAKKTHRGMEGLALRGLATGGRCFGYRTIDSGGEKRLAAYEPEAAVVRRIFAMSAAGVSVKKIARALNAEGTLNPQPYRGQRHPSWAPSAVSVMLRNERYSGRAVWNRTRKIRNPETGRRIQRRRPRTEWVVQPREHLRIVSDELFAAVQARFQCMRAACGGDMAMSSSAGLSGRAAGFLLSGFLRCGLCGSRMVIVAGKGRRAASQRYGCPLRERGVCENKLLVRRSAIEDEVLSGIEERVLSPEALSRYARRFEGMVRQRAKQQGSIAGTNRARCEELERKTSRLARLIADDENSEHLIGELRRAEAELATLRSFSAPQRQLRVELERKASRLARLIAGDENAEAELAALRAPVAPQGQLRTGPGCGQWFIRRLADLRGLLRGECDKAKAVLRESIPDGIRLIPEGLSYRITIAWELPSADLATLSGAGGQSNTQNHTVNASWIARAA